MKLPFHIDLSEKVVVITGAGGVICSTLAKAVGACGAKVALLDLNKDAAQKWADEIVAEGGVPVFDIAVDSDLDAKTIQSIMWGLLEKYEEIEGVGDE